MLRRFLRRWWPLPVLAATLVAAVYGEWSLAQHQQEQNEANTAPGQKLYEIPLPSAEGWTALFTGCLFFSTVGLWIVTRKAAVSAQLAAEHIPRVERAYLFLSGYNGNGFIIESSNQVTITDANLLGVVTNHGKTPAFLTEIYQTLTILNRLDAFQLPLPINLAHVAGQQIPNIAIQAGKDREIPYLIDDFFTNVLAWNNIARQESVLFHMGYVRYKDIFGGKHRTGFCLFYDNSTNQFISIGGDDYNYATDESD